MMNEQPARNRTRELTQWRIHLQDTESLLESPLRHHRALLQRAYSLHLAQVIDDGELSDCLELADAAYAYALEAALDRDGGV